MMDIQMVSRRHHIPPGWRISEGITANHILVIVTEGTLRYVFDYGRDSIHLQPGEALFIPRGMCREATPCPPNYHKMYSVHFTMDDFDLDVPLLRQSSYCKIHSSHFDYMKHRFALLVEKWVAQLPYYTLNCQAIVLELLALFQQELELQKHSSKKLHTIAQLKQYIQSHYARPISLLELAEHINRTPNYVSRLFKEVSSQTPIQYIHQIRIAAAHEMLLNTSLTIAEIAEQTGFSDAYYFSKVYKKLMGRPPMHTITSLLE